MSEKPYDPITELTSDQNNHMLTLSIAWHLNNHDIPLPAKQVYLIAEAIAEDGGAREAWDELVRRLSR